MTAAPRRASNERVIVLHQSNRTEELVDALCEAVGKRPPDPFARECIVVQGKGMERWLAMELARRLGIWANAEFPFPRSIVERALATRRGDLPELARLYEPETMLWSIARLLDQLRRRPDFAVIERYLQEDEPCGRKKIQLAERIANTFDHYTVYRPDMLLGWERGTGGDWQAVLWRELSARHGPHHLAARCAAFHRARPDEIDLAAFPARVSLFGMSTLPPAYLDLFRELARRGVEVHLFVLAPSVDYWADIRSERDRTREAARLAAAGKAGGTAIRASAGNPLLASLGRLGAEFQDLLLAVDFDREDERWVEPPTDTALGRLQSDIFHLVHRTDRTDPTDASGVERREPALPLPDNDDSIRVHSCHGAMREVEVLRDQLLDLFARDPSLQPHDVIVMTPSIDAYAPYVEAAFSQRHAASAAEPSIPFRIADRGVRATNQTFEAFCAVLDILRGRFTAAELLDLLGIELIRTRFAIEATEIDLIRNWVIDAGIRWGVDGAHRKAAGLPELDENTWRFGLRRLFLGYSMEGRDQRLFQGTLPYDDVEGKAAAALGKLAELCDVLFQARARVESPRAPAAWHEELSMLLAATVADTNGSEHREIVAASLAVAARAQDAGFDGEIDLASARAQLEGELTRRGSARGFLSGGVTFCELVPMRTIPFRVVCLIGLNDASFPRTRRPPGFDLIAQHPRAGDRSQREDDRYLFLEALLSARDRLIITFTGQSIRDNAPLPPSVVVSELLDRLDDSFRLAPAKMNEAGAAPEAAGEEAARGQEQPRARDAILVRHPLQPFSPKYFGAGGDPRLFSYSAACARGAAALRGARSDPSPFVRAPLPLREAPGELDLESLVRFFDHPTRHFCQRRLELRLEERVGIAPEREPIELGHLERWQVGDWLLRAAADAAGMPETFKVVRARGDLPPGALGEVCFSGVQNAVAKIAAAAEARCGQRLEPLPFELDLGGVRLAGVLRNLTAGGIVEAQYSRLGGHHELRLWIRHLVLQIVAPKNARPESVLIGREGDEADAVRLQPVCDAREHLEQLIALYRKGLEAPLPFFRNASRAYAQAWRMKPNRNNPDPHQRALKNAGKAFAGNDFSGGDWDDPYVLLLYGGARHPQRAFDDLIARGGGMANPDGFEKLACEVWNPLLDHREKIDP